MGEVVVDLQHLPNLVVLSLAVPAGLEVHRVHVARALEDVVRAFGASVDETGALRQHEDLLEAEVTRCCTRLLDDVVAPAHASIAPPCLG